MVWCISGSDQRDIRLSCWKHKSEQLVDLFFHVSKAILLVTSFVGTNNYVVSFCHWPDTLKTKTLQPKPGRRKFSVRPLKRYKPAWFLFPINNALPGTKKWHRTRTNSVVSKISFLFSLLVVRRIRARNKMECKSTVKPKQETKAFKMARHIWARL